MIFLDSRFIIACKVADDENHEKAMKYLYKFVENKEDITISDYIFDEVVTVLFLKTKDLNIAVDTGNILKNSTNLLKISESIFEKSWESFKAQKSTKLSFTDCSTLVLMKKEGINKLATFDEDFKKIKEIEVFGE